MTKPTTDTRAYAERLDTPRPIRKFWMSTELHAAASAYAWENKSTISALIREQLSDIEREPLDPARMTEYDSSSSRNSVSVAVEDDLYFAAKDAAYPTRHSLTSLIRRRLLKILESEGRWPAAA